MATTIGSLDLASLKNLRDDLTQYFWFESSASATYGAGVHVTLVPDTTFMSNPTGQNILMNTDGISIRNGLLPMMTLDNNSLNFNVVNTTAGTYTTTATFGSTGATIGQTSGAHIQISSSGLNVNTNSSTNIASFGTNGARIGKNNAAHSIIDANGQRFYATNGTTQLANIGYGEGTPESGTTPVTAPYYDFGIRKSNTTKGNYSVAEGVNNTVSGYACHAEGTYNINSGYTSHAEGTQNTISGSYSHVGGFYNSISGIISRASGIGLVSTKAAQTIIGIANIEDTNTGEKTIPLSTYTSADCGKYAFIIGNGTVRHPLFEIDDTSFSRSNAFTVDWDGNVTAAQNITVNNHTSYIGTMKSYTSDEISCASGRYYQLAYLTLEAGVWMVDYVGYFPNTNTTGVRDTFVTTATSNYNNVTTAPASYGNITRDRRKGENHNIYCKSHFPVNITSTTTFRLIGYQTSGTTNSLTGRMYAVRIN